ncbi:hypothetical protein ACP70R_019376 [Stipagrostis hirtigluma subsp. patula]
MGVAMAELKKTKVAAAACLLLLVLLVGQPPVLAERGGADEEPLPDLEAVEKYDAADEARLTQAFPICVKCINWACAVSICHIKCPRVCPVPLNHGGDQDRFAERADAAPGGGDEDDQPLLSLEAAAEMEKRDAGEARRPRQFPFCLTCRNRGCYMQICRVYCPHLCAREKRGGEIGFAERVVAAAVAAALE